MPALVPIVEVAHHADHLSIRRPDRETNAVDPQAFDHVGSHAAIALILGSLAVDVQIEIGDQPGKSVRVLDICVLAVPERQMQLVISRIVWQRGDKESFGARFAHGVGGAIRHHRGIHGLRKERAHFPAIRHLMRAQHGKRIAVRTVEDGFQFLRSHAQLLWQRVVTGQELGTDFPYEESGTARTSGRIHWSRDADGDRSFTHAPGDRGLFDVHFVPAVLAGLHLG